MKVLSRANVQVVLRERRSTAPEARRSKRSDGVVETKLTLPGSPRIAAATARQNPTSRPLQASRQNPRRGRYNATGVAPIHSALVVFILIVISVDRLMLLVNLVGP